MKNSSHDMTSPPATPPLATPPITSFIKMELQLLPCGLKKWLNPLVEMQLFNQRLNPTGQLTEEQVLGELFPTLLFFPY